MLLGFTQALFECFPLKWLVEMTQSLSKYNVPNNGIVLINGSEYRVPHTSISMKVMKTNL